MRRGGVSASVGKMLLDGEWTAAAYVAGWKIAHRIPRSWGARLARAGADWASKKDSATFYLRRNLARVVGDTHVDDELVRASLRSYARYWLEAFSLPALSSDTELMGRLTQGVEGRDVFERSLARGRGVVLVLPHSGNWDMAGMWLAKNYGEFTTVAERLKPEALFEAFVDFRRSLGFDVHALSGGEGPPYEALLARLRQGGVVCLLGERDLKGTGIEVEFFGERTTFPAGPAQLALDTGATVHVVHSWFTEDETGPGWGLSCSPEIAVDNLNNTMQRIADVMASNIADHPDDWHMLQPLWPRDRRKH